MSPGNALTMHVDDAAAVAELVGPLYDRQCNQCVLTFGGSGFVGSVMKAEATLDLAL